MSSIDPGNYLTMDDITGIVALINKLNELADGFDFVAGSEVSLSDTNGDALGDLKYSDGGFAYYPNGT